MDFKSFQDYVRKTAIYKNVDHNLVYVALGLAGEAGEVADKVKKLLRDANGELDRSRREELIKELGDVLWYTAALANELQVDLSAVAKKNVEKIEDRRARGVMHGEGDNR